ncbi:hypothetical protein NX059_003398 [Plenodomus lindquistii]|nr:hypothetical protein NX059_003398 [Plenodomus lindquistii]
MGRPPKLPRVAAPDQSRITTFFSKAGQLPVPPPLVSNDKPESRHTDTSDEDNEMQSRGRAGRKRHTISDEDDEKIPSRGWRRKERHTTSDDDEEILIPGQAREQDHASSDDDREIQITS